MNPDSFLRPMSDRNVQHSDDEQPVRELWSARSRSSCIDLIHGIRGITGGDGLNQYDMVKLRESKPVPRITVKGRYLKGNATKFTVKAFNRKMLNLYDRRGH